MDKKIKNVEKDNCKPSNLYRLNGRVPLLKAIPYGLQHVLSMFVANLVPVILVCAAVVYAGDGGKISDDPVFIAQIIQSTMFVAGIATLIQLFPVWIIGSKLPVIMGCSFTFLGSLIVIGTNPEWGYEGMLGAVIVGGVIEGFLGLTAKYWKHFISPIVSGCVVATIGFSLLSVGATSFAGGDVTATDFGAWYYIVIAAITLISSIVFKIVANKNWENLNILFGIIVGYVVSLIFKFTGIADVIDFSVLGHAVDQLGHFNFPLPIFFHGIMPTFHLDAIVTIIFIFLVSAAETIGDTSAVCQGGLDREVTDKEISGSLAIDGFGSALSGIFGSCPITSFSQNVGLVSVTKVVNRFTIATGVILLIFCSFFPPLGAIFSTIPSPVMGGCTVLLFGSITYTGIGMITKAGTSERNLIIVSVAFSLGIGSTLLGAANESFFSAFPPLVVNIFSANSVAGVFLIAFLLDTFLPGKPKKNADEKLEDKKEKELEA